MAIHVFVDKDGNSIYFEHLCSGTHFYELRLAISESLENGKKGSRFPVLQKTPDYEAYFSIEQTKALRKEIKTILQEKDKFIREYKNIPYLTLQGIVPKDFDMPLDFIVSRLEIILKGCKIAIESNGTLGWVY